MSGNSDAFLIALLPVTFSAVLLALVSLWPAFRVVRIAWTGYADGAQMERARADARAAHVVVCAIILLSCFQPG